MKKVSKLILAFLAAMLFATSCKDDGHELGALLDKSEIKYEVTQDLVKDPGGNTVIMKNNTPGTVSMWDYGTGRSNRAIDTVHFAFKGDYVIKFSALTAGGVVEMDPITVTVTADNLNYVNDPLWSALSGGVGHEKTWLLDLDANGVSKYFDGPLYFYGTNNGYEGACLVDGGDCWNYNPDWPGNQWVMGKADFGSMTFSLQGGPFIAAHHTNIPSRGDESGTYFLDINTKVLTITDATPLHDIERDGCVGAWGDIRVFSVTEDYMQLAVLRTSCEGPCLLVYNYISKAYSDAWVPDTPPPPTEDPGFNPTFAAGELLDMLTGGPSAGRVWKLDSDGNPVDWVAHGKGWTADAGSSFDWGWNGTWVTAVTDSWIRFDRWGGQNYTRYQDGATTTGTFTINESTNEVTLVGNTLLQNAASWMNPTANTIKVIKGFPTDYGTKGVWFGTAYDAGKDEWLVYHYIMPN